MSNEYNSDPDRTFQDDYPVEAEEQRLRSIVGTKVEMPHQGTYLVKDMVHDHYFLVRESDGYSKMERTKTIDELVAEQKKAASMGEAFGEIFARKGAFEGTWSSSCSVPYGGGPKFHIDGVMGGLMGKHRGCMSDVVQLYCNRNEYDDYMVIGTGGRSYSIHREIRPDITKECGYTVIDHGHDMKLDEMGWFPVEELLDRMMIKLTESLDKEIHLKGKIFNCSHDKEGIYYWEDNGKIVYNVRGPVIDESWQKKCWVIIFGAVKKHPTTTARGTAKHGRDNEKWTFPSSEWKMTGEEIRDSILNMTRSALSEISFRRKHS